MKITYPPKKVFIKRMLRDHLLSYRLLQGLERIGFDITNFDLFLADTIFSLLGFGNSAEEEKLFEDFLMWSQKVLDIDFSLNRREPIDELCNEIYRRLEMEQKLRKLKKKVTAY